MAFRKRSFKKRPLKRRSNVFRRRAAPARRRPARRGGRRRAVSSNAINVKFVVQRADILVAANTTSVIRTDSVLTDYTQATTYTALFRRFRINAVKYTYIPKYNQAPMATAGLGGWVFTYPTRWTGNTVVETVPQALNTSGCKRRPFYKPFSVYYRPTCTNIMGQLPDNVVNLEAVPVKAPWLDTGSSTDIIHQGHGLLIEAEATPAQFNVIETLYVSFRNRYV